MDSKVTGRMSTISTSIADSTDSRVSDLIEAEYINTRFSTESPSQTCMSSSVRHFGTAGYLFHGSNTNSDSAVLKDCTMLDGKHFYDRSGEYLKCDGMSWGNFVKLQRTNVATAESLHSRASLNPSPTSGACKFIKDEKEPSVIMDQSCSSFDPSAEIAALDSCCDSDTKLSDGESSSFTSAAAAAPRPVLDGSQNCMIELNQSEQVRALSQVRTDSRSGLSPAQHQHKHQQVNQHHQHHQQHVSMYKSEVPRWQMQTSPAEPQYWCPSAGGTEDPYAHSGYDGIQNQNQGLAQRNSSPFSMFPG